MNIGLAKTTITVTQTLYLPFRDHVHIKLYQSGKDKDQLTSRSFIKRYLERNFRFSAQLFFTRTFAFSRVSFQIFFFTCTRLVFTCVFWGFFSRAKPNFHVHFSMQFQIFSRALFFFTCKTLKISEIFTGVFFFSRQKKKTRPSFSNYCPHK